MAYYNAPGWEERKIQVFVIWLFCSRDKQVFIRLGSSRQGTGGDRDEVEQEGEEAGV